MKLMVLAGSARQLFMSPKPFVSKNNELTYDFFSNYTQLNSYRNKALRNAKYKSLREACSAELRYLDAAGKLNSIPVAQILNQLNTFGFCVITNCGLWFPKGKAFSNGHYGSVSYVNSYLKSSESKTELQSFCKKLVREIPFFSSILAGRVSLYHQTLIAEAAEVPGTDTNTVLHSDRFTPSLKLFYSPKTIHRNNAPFEYVVNSQLLNQEFYAAWKTFFWQVAKGVCAPMPAAIPLDVEERNRRCLLCDEDTMVLAWTHGLHRRTEFHMQGYRESIWALFYGAQHRWCF